MSKRDDIDKLYKKSNMIGSAAIYFYIVHVLISVMIIFSSGNIQKFWSILLIITDGLFMILDLWDTGILRYRAESERRKDAIQNAFSCHLTEMKTEGYYNNRLRPSFEKYAMNIFESNFFSKFISGKMIGMSLIKSLIAIFLLFVCGIYVIDANIYTIIVQTAFSTFIVGDTISLLLYYIRMKQLYDEAYLQFITIGLKEDSQKVWLMSYIMEYEMIKAHYKVQLNSKIFHKYNDSLSKQWTEIEENAVKKIQLKNHIL